MEPTPTVPTPTAPIAPVDYEITGEGIPRIRGVMAPIPGTNRVSATVSLPTGTNYTVLVSSLVDDGKTDCRTSGMFDIADGQSTKLELTLQCDELGAHQGQPGSGGQPPDAGGQTDVADCGPDAETADAGAIPSSSSVAVIAPPVSPVKDTGVPVVSVGALDAGAAKETCAVCSQRMCGDSQGSRLWADCYLSTDRVVAGAAAGKSKAQACSDVLSCAHSMGCSSANPDACYCGEGTSVASCLTYGATGSCRGVWEEAGESIKANDLLRENAVWQDTALGLAVRLMACEASACAATCAARR
jgi:hypothetical protein